MYFVLLFLITGLFYPALSIACSIFMGGYYWYLKRKRKQIMRFNCIDLAIGILVVLSFLTTFWAVDKGMTLIGAAKELTLLWFCLIIKQWDKTDLEKMVHLIPKFAGASVILSAITFLTPAQSYFFIAGRLAGPFGYANSYALFLLLSMGILFVTEKLFDWRNLLLIAILIGGIIWSASRIVGVLTGVFLVVQIIKMLLDKKNKKQGVFVGIGICLIIGIGALFPPVQRLYMRLTDVSFHSSTLLGRFLYVRDGIALLRRFPQGLGFFGYSYTNGLTATGLYEIKYVHQALLQLALDLGIGFAVTFLIVLLYGVKRARVYHNPYAGVLLIAIVHAMFDIDMEYISIPIILLLLVQKESQDIGWEIHKRALSGAVCGVSLISLLTIPIMLANACYLFGSFENALVLYPWYTEAREEKIDMDEDFETIQQDANALVKQNAYSAKGWQMMGALAYVENDYQSMENYFDRELELVPYQNTEYEMYRLLLEEMVEQNAQDERLVASCNAKLKELNELKQMRLSNMSRLGKKIADQPEF